MTDISGERRMAELYFDVIHKITLRAEAMDKKVNGVDVTAWSRLTMHMDLDHANASEPIDLLALLDAKDGDFAHDVFGIRKHINRETGKLEDCFLPRYARVCQ